MQTTKERTKLLERYGTDEPRPLLAVLKCVVGLVVLCAVAAAPWLLAGSGGGDTPAAYPDSIAESKRIFDERRERYEAHRESEVPQGGAIAADVARP